MKILIILALSVIIFGCSNTITTERDFDFPYKVESITKCNNIYCLYHLNTDVFLVKTQNKLVVRDSIGKFNINDTIYVTLIKK